MSYKYFCLVLHSHIPYVLAHGDWPHGMDWLYEAASESYLPLLDILQRLIEEGISPQINISFTPVCADQLKNKSFQEGFANYLTMKKEIARKDRNYFINTGNKILSELSSFWEKLYEKLHQNFCEKYKKDIIESYRILQDEGHVEILTSAATHAYLPLVSRDETIQHQIHQGKYISRLFFGKELKGFWLPECAYRPNYVWKPPLGKRRAYARQGVDEILKKLGIEYFFVDSHLLRGGEVKGVYAERFPALKLLWNKFKDEYSQHQESSQDPFFPYLVHPSGLAFLVRDEVSGTQVWSRDSGYPGDGWYLEFHKKHFPGGMRYWRITSSLADLAAKNPYEPQRAKEKIEEHASHFVHTLHEILKQKKEGIVVALYDTELFGHWWFEGPEWLYLVLKKLNQSSLKPLRASECLERIPAQKIISLPEGSWGQGGFHWVWLNENTSWIWEKIYEIEDMTIGLEKKTVLKNKRVLKQFFREKFLLESSDWPFLISTWSARDYAEVRAAEHYERAKALGRWLCQKKELRAEEEGLLSSWEKEDNLFKEILDFNGKLI